jgi:hypothetical protein
VCCSLIERFSSHLCSIVPAGNAAPSPTVSTYLNTHQSHAAAATATPQPTSSVLNDDEQQLLDAIHSHPNKRDLVMNLLRQMNQSPSTGQQQQQQSRPGYPQRQSNPSTPRDPYEKHANMEDDG